MQQAQGHLQGAEAVRWTGHRAGELDEEARREQVPGRDAVASDGAFVAQLLEGGERRGDSPLELDAAADVELRLGRVEEHAVDSRELQALAAAPHAVLDVRGSEGVPRQRQV